MSNASSSQENLQRRLAKLSPEKRALLELKLKQRQAKITPDQSIIQTLDQREHIPLSFAQQRLWFITQLEGDSAIYNMSRVFRLSGCLDVAALQQAVQEIVQRHEVLRTSFVSINDFPIQKIAASVTIPLPLEDLQPLPEDRQSAEINRLVKAEKRYPFDLSTAPLLRLRLLRLGAEDHLLVLVIHHMLCDGWSIGIFIRELSALYSAFAQAEPSPLDSLPIQYADFAAWQRQWLRGDALDTQLNYWRRQLGGDLPVLQLPTDYPRPAAQDYRGGSTTLNLSASLTTELKTLSQQAEGTLFMTLLAAFQTLLHRLSGQNDIIIGSPIAGRPQVKTEGLIGIFLNSLALRSDLGDNPTFRQLLMRVREATLGAYAHQDIPFEKLVEVLQPERSLSRHPIFEVMLNFFNTPKTSWELPDLDLKPIEFEKEESKFTLTLYVEEQAQSLRLRLVYQRALFSPERMQCFLEQLQYLLEQVAANPDRLIRSYSLVTPNYQSLLPNPRTALPCPYYAPVTTLFTDWSERQPEQPAICQGDRAWSYGELARRAGAIAQQLLKQNLTPGEVVAVSGERSFGLIASILGILRAGGVMLTLDPNLPIQRRQVMVSEANAKHFIAVSEPQSELDPGSAAIQAFHIRAETGQIINANLEHEGEVTLPSLAPEDPAYIFFTSGTTGVPKGVLGRHQGLAHFLHWQRQTFTIGPADRIAQLTSLSFDVVLRDIFLPLTSGAVLCLPTAEDALTPSQLPPWLEQQQITVLHTVPTLAATWLAAEPDGVSLDRLRWIFLAGEPLPAGLVKRWRQVFPQAGEVVNLYGPTETTLAKCYYRVPADPVEGIQPVGAPLPETQALILSQHHQLGGIGEPGEIVLRTPFRTLGYLNAMDEQARRFLPNPFRQDKQDLLYYTGDLGRYRPDGLIEILGRLDHQVKIRGVRIELGEIEAALRQHLTVQETVVIVREDSSRDRCLVAYLVAATDQTVDRAELRRHLKQTLPEVMIPAAFIELSTLPLSANGKVNRRALPAPNESELEPSVTFVAPHTPTEEILTNIWSAVLNRQQVGILHNFFELGGHSLRAAQIMSRVRDAFQVDLPLRNLFEFPTIQALSQKIDALQQADRGEYSPPTIKPVKRTGDLPLSFSQQRLWFIDQLEGPSATYNIFRRFRLQGSLNVMALQQAMQAIVQRHEVLRTTFVKIDDNPIQTIKPVITLTLPTVDLHTLSAEQQSLEVQRLVHEESRCPFDLERGPLIRGKLLCLAEQSHILFFTVHHIVADGWSMGILRQELITLYQAFTTGEPSPLPPLEIQYADFTDWQRQWLQGAVLDLQLNYWKQQLMGAPSLLELPTDRPRAPVQTYRGQTEKFYLSASLTEQIKTLSQTAGVTLYMTLLAAFKLLLGRYSGQDDIVVGSPIANRNHPKLEPLIGFFVNTLVLRTNLAENPSFLDLLKRVRETTLAAYAHQDIPFEELAARLKPERSLSHSLWFQVMFVLQNMPQVNLDLPNLTVERMDGSATAAKFDLILSIKEQDSGLRGIFTYNADLFEAATLTRMASHFQHLLEAIVENPRQSITALPLLTPAEQHQLLVAWNPTPTSHTAPELCIHQLFEAQVRQTPDALAVTFVDQQLTYQQLNSQANQLAHYLQQQGRVGPETLVGLCLERSVSMVVALLGILKAGAAYVPLDPAYPPERLNFMARDAQIPILLTQSRFVDKFADLDAQVIALDQQREAIAQAASENLEAPVKPDHLAYVIYTSGSTGQPKGVMIQHCSLVNFTLAAQVEYALQPGDRILQFASISFDAAAEEIYPCLTTGGTLMLRTDDMLSSVAQFLNTCREWRITVLDLPTAYWQQLGGELAADALTLPESLRLVIIGGERVSPEHIKTWRAQVGEYPQLINTYGPTEGTVVATAYPITAASTIQPETPIGKAIANVQTYVLDQHLQPVPIGVPGELHIGGIGLARGYLNRPDLTAEHFIQNPLPIEQRSARLYKTGDKARYLPDGNLEFLGRIDHQVKIRGFRVELGEIEATLVRHPAVQQTVVMARQDQSGDQRLVAYIVSVPGQAPVMRELRQMLKQTLPDYMTPAAFVRVETLPLTPNGKVDRRALPGPDWADTGNPFMPPRTPTEELLAGIWADLLQLNPVGVHDNFFELGGHSLLAIQVVSRIRKILAVELPLRTLFESPTIAELAQRIEKGEAESASISIQPVSQDGEPPLSFGQQRLWFLDQLEGQSSAYHISRVLQLSGQLEVGVLEQAMAEIIRRHQALRTTFQRVAGKPVIVITPAEPLKLPVVDLPSGSDQDRLAEVQRLADEFARQPFDLSRDRLIRIKLLKLGSESHVLLVTMHHIVSDGWSLGIFIRELSTLYRDFSQAEPSSLPALPIQYADFAHWQRRRLQGDGLESRLSYWKQQLGGRLPVLQLPTDFPRPAEQDHRGDRHAVVLSESLTAQLKALSRQSSATLFMTLLAALNVLLHRQSGQEDIIVGCPITERLQMETEGLIGLFLNSLALRTDLSGHPTFRQLLDQVRGVTLGAYAHQEIPFEKLVEEIKPERSLSQHPIFEVMLNVMNLPKQTWELPGLSLRPLSLGDRKSKFTMTLYVREQASQLQLSLVYQRALFTSERMAGFLAQLQSLLEQVVSDPDRPITAYSLVTAGAASLLPDPSAPLPARDYDLTPSAVLNWGERRPEQTAIRQGERSWTYGELANTAKTIAHGLLAQGLTPGEVVAISGQRSFGLIASVLGVLSAGGVLLLIDPQLPYHRRQVMLAAAKAKCLLWIDPESIEAGSWPETLAVDHIAPTTGERLPPETTPSSPTAALPEIQPNDPAYIFFTSGTTGMPKGVLGSHQGLSHFLSWQRQTFEVGPDDRVAQLTGLSFDVALRDIFLPLTSGAALCLPSAAADLSAGQVLPWLEQQQITVLHTLPTLAKTWLIDTHPPINLDHLRWVFFAGEPLSDQLVKRWRQAFPEGGELVNLYGPTETSLAKCYYPVPTEPIAGTQPVGIPLPETQALLLSRSDQLCGIGEVGEIVIRTPFRTLGYINAPEEQSSRFRQNPYRDDAEDRIYYTGDLGRYRLDGSLEILGRADHQVKIRGIRIELGEIETVLVGHPAICEAVVTAREDEPGDKRLAAYVVAQAAQAPTVSELRRYLQQQLPTYMTPSAFVFLETLPLTPNGKIDRRALPAPDPALRMTDTEFVAPDTPIEEQLSRIWGELLKLEQVGIHDNFFDLGGHSLLAVQLFAEIEKTFGKKLPIATLFQSATVSAIAQVIRQENWLAPWFSLVPIKADGSKPPLFYMHAGGGNLLVYRDLALSLGDDQPVYGLQPRGLDGNIQPSNNIQEMAAFYISQIRTVQPQGPYYLAGMSTGGLIAWEMAQQLHQQGQSVDLLALFDTSGPGYPQLLPLIPRLISVLTWMGMDVIRRGLRLPGELLTEMNNQGVRASGLKLLVKLKLVKPTWDADVQFQADIVNRQINKKIDKYKKNQAMPVGRVEQLINLIITTLLSKSSHPYYANVFTSGLLRRSKTLLPDEIRTVNTANVQARKAYKPQAFPGKAILFRASERTPGIKRNPSLGWQGLATGGMKIYEVPGTHDSIIKSSKLATLLMRCLNEAQTRNGNDS